MRSLLSAVLLSGMLVGRGSAQKAPANDVGGALRKNFADVVSLLTKSADLVPADKYGYRPVATVRTFGQLVGHLADAHNYYCAVASGKKVEWSDPIEKGVSDKPTLVKKLKESIELCNRVYAGNGDAATMIENIAHTNHHYGNMVTYVRMLGLVPPQS
jgi:uncharacterized damage-inducible protein DinB